MTRSERYFVGIVAHFTDMGFANNLEICDCTLSLSLTTGTGRVNVSLTFFPWSVMVYARHSRAAGNDHERVVASSVMREYNHYYGESDAFGLSDKGEPAFTMDYNFRYRGPVRDFGLEDFCSYMTKTIPARLETIARLFAEDTTATRSSNADDHALAAV